MQAHEMETYLEDAKNSGNPSLIGLALVVEELQRQIKYLMGFGNIPPGSLVEPKRG